MAFLSKPFSVAFLILSITLLTPSLTLPAKKVKIKKKGKMIYFYDSGSKKESGINLNYLKVGTWETFYPSGELLMRGEYVVQGKNSLREGFWKKYNSKGEVSGLIPYASGKKTGNAFYLSPNGKTNEIISFKDGSKDGSNLSFYESGNAKSRGQYIAGYKSGEWNIFYPSGASRSKVKYNKGKMNGPYISHHGNGLKHISGVYDQGIKNGDWEESSASGKVIYRGHMQMGNREGYWEFFENGIPLASVSYIGGLTNGLGEIYKKGKKLTTSFYSNNLKVKLETVYHPNGVISGMGSYKNGKKSGDWKFYNDKNDLISSGKYELGKLHGIWKTWYPTRKVKTMGKYFYGAKKGLFDFYTENGAMTKQVTYVSSSSIKGKMVFYQGGKKHYEFEVGFPVIKISSLMVNGKPNPKSLTGVFIEYFPDGKTIKEKGTYKKMMGKHGKWITYDKTGKELSSAEYYFGKIKDSKF